ncbi:winged helix-turn-helix transcriptional regulator [Pectinatus haikarae]|uniref:DNA-binding HxlR family transcriptional regulator n=1 Tax=Pectinatus haikarae TaxID=349096 RepID=A0ABT9YA94_9FIRM|nr:helix-turn-helix domain-containing protein [Pectinatus haikarae]MDQ0204737.1 DNA-binding HxlR family transcriptional regulator [Pectinatus haikarae]
MEKTLPDCPVETTLMLISDKWKLLIIRDLLDGKKRFGELKKSVGKISQKILTADLRSMEKDGLLSRKVFAEMPPRVEYTLTPAGLSLKSVIEAMSNWGQYYQKNLSANKSGK